MAKKYFQKALSVGLSLALCAGMIAPAFAHTVYLGNDTNGETVDTVQAGVDKIVASEGKSGRIEMDRNATEDVKIRGENVDVTLDMNGNTLTGTGTGSVITVTGGASLTVNGAKEGEDGNTVKGVITGGNANVGGGIYVQGNTLKDIDLPELNLSNVVIEKNHAVDGGGVYASDAKVTMDGVDVRDNGSSNNGGGVYVGATSNNKREGSSLTMTDTRIENNSAVYGGGLHAYAADTKKTVVTADKDTVIANNTADTKHASDPDNDIIWATGDDICIVGSKVTLKGFGAPQGETLTEDGKPITGWYWDMAYTDRNAGWGNNGAYSYYEYSSINGKWGNSVGLKAAHGQYFGASYYLDEEASELYASFEANDGVEKGSEAKFTDPSTVPTREGYVFDSWKAVAGVDENGNVTGEVKFVAQWKEAEPEPVEPDPANPAEPDPTVEIDDPEVPLAGLFTRADAIGYLWEQAGEPEAELSDFPDVPEDHQWAVAIGWAQDMGIALPDQEGNFRPDDLVLRSVESLEVSPEGELQEFLDRYAVYAGIELAEGEHFYELDGAFDDVIMGEDAQVIFDEFFAKLEAALVGQAA